MGGSTLLSDQNKVYITALDSEGDILSSEYQTQLVESLEADFSSPTEVIEFYSSTKVYICFEVTGSYSNSTSNIVSTLIKDAYFIYLGISSIKHRPVKVTCVKKIRVVHEKTRLLT